MKRHSLILLSILFSIHQLAFAQHFSQKSIKQYMAHVYHQSQTKRHHD
ncbi:MAG: hypothetical protein QG556_228 [Pseudomonadota bacterium]|nr:hypothetical protein [Pseudomonadota bacterium]